MTPSRHPRARHRSPGSALPRFDLEVHGGYAFAGSTSTIDLHALTGWLPEQVHFESEEDRARDRRREGRAPLGLAQVSL